MFAFTFDFSVKLRTFTLTFTKYGVNYTYHVNFKSKSPQLS